MASRRFEPCPDDHARGVIALMKGQAGSAKSLAADAQRLAWAGQSDVPQSEHSMLPERPQASPSPSCTPRTGTTPQ